MDQLESGQFKELNRQEISAAASRLLSQDVVPNTIVSEPLGEIFIDGKSVKGCKLEFTVLGDDHFSLMRLVDSKGSQLAVRTVIFGMGQKDAGVVKITGSIDTVNGYEGNGFAKGLMAQTDHQIQKSSKILDIHHVKAAYFVTDNAEGQQKDRRLWTYETMKELGFITDPKLIKKAADSLGHDITEEELQKTALRIYDIR